MYLEEATADESRNKTQYCRTADSIEVKLASDVLLSGSRFLQTREVPIDTIPLDSVTLDEFSQTIDIVGVYFGSLIDDVAVHASISRRQLVAVLARAQLSGRQLDTAGLTDNGDIVHQSNDETLFWLDGGFWTDLGGLHYLSPDEGRAAREVHRRLIEAVAGDVADYNRERDPFIVITERVREVRRRGRGRGAARGLFEPERVGADGDGRYDGRRPSHHDRSIRAPSRRSVRWPSMSRRRASSHISRSFPTWRRR